MRFNDALTGGVLVIFAIAEITYTRTFPSLFGQSYGPDLFPRIIGYGLLATGTLLIARGVLQKIRAGAQGRWVALGPWVGQSHHEINLLLVLFALIAYIFLSDWVGFMPMSMLILSVLLYRLGSSISVSLLIAAVTTAVLHVMFAKLLLVPLPTGLLTGLVY